MPSDREEALKRAEKLLRQGKLDLAIAEYARMLEENPRDWNSANSLGDLYVRAGQTDKAVAQYTRIADHLLHEGFLPRAAALFKKILKIAPDDEGVQLHLGEISAKQGLLADAKGYFTAVAHRRRARGDKPGADEIVVRLGSLDPADIDARVAAARTLEAGGEDIGAAMRYRELHADLIEKGRVQEAFGALREAVRLNPDDLEGKAEIARAAVDAGDLETARQYLTRDNAGNDPALLMALLQIELRGGAIDAARELLTHLLTVDPALQSRIIELAWALGEGAPEAAFVCIDTVVDAELASRNFMDAAALLQEFVTRVSGQVPALLKLVEICVDGNLEAAMYETQAQLADAYLEAGQAAEARVIAEDLVAREPWEPAHIERFRRSLTLLNVADPDALIAERLSGQGPFVATDPFMAADLIPDSRAPEEEAAPVAAAPEPPVVEPAPSHLAAAEPEPKPVEQAPPPTPAPPAPRGKRPAMEIDLNDALAALDAPPPQPVAAPRASLDAVLQDARDQAQRASGGDEADERMKLALTYLEMGMTDEAIESLAIAARSPVHRFAASSTLGRLYVKRGDLVHGVEWLERGAEAPAPGATEGRDLLYDLGATLETQGETSRALAVFLELQADAGEYRDVAARVERLARVETGG